MLLRASQCLHRRPWRLLALPFALALGTAGCNGGTAVQARVTEVTQASFMLTLAPGVPDMTPADLKLTPAVSIVAVTATGASHTRYAVATETFTLGQEYTLRLTKSGYSTPDVTFTSPVPLEARVTEVTQASFTLTLMPGVPDMTPVDLKLTPSVPIEAVTPIDTPDTSYTSHRVATEAFATGQTYTLAITKSDYAMTYTTFTPPNIAVDADVTGTTPTGFTLTLMPGVPGLTRADLQLTPSVPIETATATGASHTRYTVATEVLTPAQEYTLRLTKSGYSTPDVTFTATLPVQAGVTGVTHTGFILTLAPGVPGIAPEDLQLTPPVAIETVKKASAFHTYYTVATAAFTPGQEYTLRLTKSGYSTPDVTFTATLPVQAAVTEVTQASFTLTLMPGVPGIAPEDLQLTPPVAIETVTALDTSNTRHTVTTVETEAFTPGQAYTLALTKAGYAIANTGFTLPFPVQAGVTGVTHTGFTLTLAPGVPGISDADLRLTPPVPIKTVRAVIASNESYAVVTEAFTPGEAYTLALTKAGYAIQDAPFTAPTLAVQAGVTGPATTGFTLTLAPGVPGIAPEDLQLTPPVTIETATATDASNESYTVVTEALTLGRPHTLALTKAGYAIQDVTFTPPVAVTAAATAGPTATGFTLTLAPGVPGLTGAALKLRPSVAIKTATATGASNESYTVVTEALALRQEYTLTLTKSGYALANSPSFTRSTASTEADISKITLTVHGVDVAGDITGTTIRFPHGAKGQSGPALEGIVSLTLSGGAQADGLEAAQTYGSTAKNIVVRAEDGTTEKTYSVTVTAYDASQNPYGVYTPAQLHAVRSARQVNYRLMRDVTLPAAGSGSGCSAVPDGFQPDYCANGFQPIETFTGTFNGDGHSIRNLFIARGSTDSVGLFSALGASGAIRNLGVTTAAAGVTGRATVGGLLGTLEGGSITEAYVTGAVVGSGDDVGGLIGEMTAGSVGNCHAAATVVGSGANVGGLIGALEAGSITEAYAAGTVSGSSDVGGLVGTLQAGSVTKAYAAGTVSGSTNVGGLVGTLQTGRVTNAYAVGAASGSGDAVGGLVGKMAGGSVTTCYATGAVSGSSDVGGLVGEKASTGTLTSAYYPSGRPAGAGGMALPSGATQTHFAGFAFSGTPAPWEWVDGDGNWPKLTGFEAPQITPSLTFYAATVVPSPNTAGFTLALAPALGVRARGDWALYEGATSAVAALLRAFTASDGANYTFTASLAAGKRYRLFYTKPDVIVIPSSGTPITVSPPMQYEVTQMTLSVHGVVLPGTITGRSIVFPFAPRGNALTGTVAIGLTSGATLKDAALNHSQQTYSRTAKTFVVQTAGGEKSFSVTTAAYDASQNPYGVYTPAQLHALGSGPQDNYLLMQSLILPNVGCQTKPGGFQDDYCAKGFQPIGTDAAPFTGTFYGNGHAIRNLSIARGDADSVGLFGYVGASGTIRHVGVNLAAGGVTGSANVGGLVGTHTGTVTGCYAAGAVVGRGLNVGGLVGHMEGGVVSDCYAAGTVTGSSAVGGLVGHTLNAFARISNCYAVAAASGSGLNVGGLVGHMEGGTVSSCYASGAVSGSGRSVGGFVGKQDGALSNAYYPEGRPAGAGGTALSSHATQTHFAGFAFSGAHAAWVWVAGKWPRLTGMEAAQTTPSRSYHTAAVSAPTTAGFTLALTPPLRGRTAPHNWALYGGGSTTNAVAAASIASGSGGASYTFTGVTLAAGEAYQLLYTQPDVIVVPSAPGPIAVTVP